MIDRVSAAGRAVALAVLAAVLLAGCTRPVGDFGRAQPSVLHDSVMPFAGGLAAEAAGEPVSDFVLTDEEREMHDRVWRFLVAPHAHDWFYDIAVEWQRTRLTGITDIRFAPDRYYAHLIATHYNSSSVRYRTLVHDIEIDLATLPGTFRAICAVIEIDRRRATAVGRVEFAGRDADSQVAARRFENSERIAWFARALRHRYTSYAIALDRLLVETPHEEARLVAPVLTALEARVLQAESGAYCPGATGTVAVNPAAPLPSRFELEPVLDLPPK